jgi:ABC-type uncharacterized transport system ATPase subunit
LSIQEIRKKHIAHIPEDRMAYGVAALATIEENMIGDKIDEPSLNKGWLLNKGAIKSFAKKMTEQYKVKCDSPVQPVRMLSGGNIQKVVVARELSSKPELLIADQPSRGIDVGSTEFIHHKLIELRDEGTAVLLVSADLNEVMELSDSLIVMYGGEIVAYFPERAFYTEEELGFYMLGLKRQSEDEIRGALHAQ